MAQTKIAFVAALGPRTDLIKSLAPPEVEVTLVEVHDSLQHIGSKGGALIEWTKANSLRVVEHEAIPRGPTLRRHPVVRIDKKRCKIINICMRAPE